MGGLARRPARRERARRAAAGLLLALFAGACASTPETGPAAGPVHVVRPGENLYRLSRHYGVSVEAIRRANAIDDVTRLAVGQRLVIPGSQVDPPSASLAGAAQAESRFASSGAIHARRDLDLTFQWPISGRPSSRFGWRRGRRHDGIDIPARKGTPIRAAEAGRVIHSGRGLGDYGKVVIVKHAGRYSTVYAHNRRNRVEVGDFVEKGQVIAEVGDTGNATGNHVHFEVRRDRRPEDPLLYLP